MGISSLILNANRGSLQNAQNTKHKIEARDIYNYLTDLGVKPKWDDVQFLIRRFLYESPDFRVNNPLRWDYRENTETDDTHCESTDKPRGSKDQKRVRHSIISLNRLSHKPDGIQLKMIITSISITPMRKTKPTNLRS